MQRRRSGFSASRGWGGYGAFGSRRYQRTVLSEYAGKIMRRGRGPGSQPLADHFRGDFEIDGASVRINGDGIALAHRGDRAAISCLGDDVGHHEAVRGAAETA